MTSPDPLPFILLPRADGRHELRAFSDDSEDAIVLVLDDAEGRKLGRAVAEVLDGIDSKAEQKTIRLVIDGRHVEIVGTSDGGLRLIVGR